MQAGRKQKRKETIKVDKRENKRKKKNGKK